MATGSAQLKTVLYWTPFHRWRVTCVQIRTWAAVGVSQKPLEDNATVLFLSLAKVVVEYFA